MSVSSRSPFVGRQWILSGIDQFGQAGIGWTEISPSQFPTELDVLRHFLRAVAQFSPISAHRARRSRVAAAAIPGDQRVPVVST